MESWLYYKSPVIIIQQTMLVSKKKKTDTDTGTSFKTLLMYGAHADHPTGFGWTEVRVDERMYIIHVDRTSFRRMRESNGARAVRPEDFTKYNTVYLPGVAERSDYIEPVQTLENTYEIGIEAVMDGLYDEYLDYNCCFYSRNPSNVMPVDPDGLLGDWFLPFVTKFT